jgi:hypothetical protein
LAESRETDERIINIISKIQLMRYFRQMYFTTSWLETNVDLRNCKFKIGKKATTSLFRTKLFQAITLKPLTMTKIWFYTDATQLKTEFRYSTNGISIAIATNFTNVLLEECMKIVGAVTEKNTVVAMKFMAKVFYTKGVNCWKLSLQLQKN